MVRDVEAPIEQRPPAGAGHGQLVDRGVSVALSLQCRVGDGVASVINNNHNIHYLENQKKEAQRDNARKQLVLRCKSKLYGFITI